MADVGLTTGAPVCASIPLSADPSEAPPDPAVVLIEMWELRRDGMLSPGGETECAICVEFKRLLEGCMR